MSDKQTKEMSDRDRQRNKQRLKSIAMATYTIAVIAGFITLVVYLYVTHKDGEPHGTRKQGVNSNAPAIHR